MVSSHLLCAYLLVLWIQLEPYSPGAHPGNPSTHWTDFFHILIYRSFIWLCSFAHHSILCMFAHPSILCSFAHPSILYRFAHPSILSVFHIRAYLVHTSSDLPSASSASSRASFSWLVSWSMRSSSCRALFSSTWHILQWRGDCGQGYVCGVCINMMRARK